MVNLSIQWEHRQGENSCIPHQHEKLITAYKEQNKYAVLPQQFRKYTSVFYRPTLLSPHPLTSLKQVNSMILQGPTQPAHSPAQPGSHSTQSTFQIFIACQLAHLQPSSLFCCGGSCITGSHQPAPHYTSRKWGSLQAQPNSVLHSKAIHLV